jgi:hypothetical protein
MRTLSSDFTWFYKFGLPILIIGGFGIFTLLLFLIPESFESSSGGDPRDGAWIGVVFLLIVSPVLIWYGMKLKWVGLDGDDFVIANSYRNHIRVPLRDVERVSGSGFIWLHFRRPTRFGSRVAFVPPTRFLRFGPHPLVRELESLVAESNAG